MGVRVKDWAIEKVLRTGQARLAQRLERLARSLGLDVVVEPRRFLLVNPRASVWLVSHLDVYGGKVPKAVERHGRYLINPKGILGGDDRAGVWIMAQLMLEGIKEYGFLFCWDEEKGCVGSRWLLENKPDLLASCRILVGLDRRGSRDVVDYDSHCPALIRFFEERGFVHRKGSISDCGVLGDGLGIPNCNLSVGFEMEHSEAEVLDVGVMEERLAQLKEWRWDLVELARSGKLELVSGWDVSDFADEFCWECGTPLDSSVEPVVEVDGRRLCWECFRWLHPEYFTAGDQEG